MVGTRLPRPRRLGLRDRTWLPFSTVRAAGPLRCPSAESVRGLLRTLHAYDPTHPLVCRVDQDRARLVPMTADALDFFLAAVVRETGDDDAETLARRLQGVADGDLPFQLLLAPWAAGMRSAHVIGDGAVANAWFTALLSPADPDSLSGLRSVARRWPLVRAVVRHFVRRPDRALRALRTSMPLAPETDPTANPVTVGVPELVTGVLGPAELSRLRDWRDLHAPGTSMAAVTMAATTRALAEHGLVGHAGVFVMMDCRRYLTSTKTAGQRAASLATGNFATGPYLLPDEVTDPRSLGATLSAAASDGVPLLLLTALTVRNAARRGRVAPLTSRASVPARPRLTLSHQGRLGLDQLPWSGETQQYVIAGEPAGPEGVTVCFSTTASGMHLSVTAHPSILDTTVLATAVRALCTDPLAWVPYGSAEISLVDAVDG